MSDKFHFGMAILTFIIILALAFLSAKLGEQYRQIHQLNEDVAALCKHVSGCKMGEK